MRPLIDMDTIQIELTNACINKCSNCTRFCGHQKPYFVTEEYFRKAFDSMIGFPKMTGFMGGEPLLHPQFADFCKYAQGKIPREQLGLWTCFPPGYEHYKEIIVETFGNVFLNDHSRNDIYHCPLLVASQEVYKDPSEMWYNIDHCWVQNTWSATINPKGAWFCEIAASLSILFNEDDKGWPIESNWWLRTPKDYIQQMERYCPRCGACASLPRRKSTDGRDDISPNNYKLLAGKSLKIRHNEYVISDLQLTREPEQMGAYRDVSWRNEVAQRYGIFFAVNDKNFLEPFLFSGKAKPKPCSIFDQLKEAYNAFEEGKVTKSV